MPKVGQQLTVTPCDEAVFVETSASTNGARVTIRALQRPGSNRTPPHRHLRQDERFEVLKGRLTYSLHGRTHTIGPGQSVTLPAGAPHEHYNADATDLEVLHTASPGLDFDYFLETAYGALAENRVKGLSFTLQGLVWIATFQGPPYVTWIPAGAQRAVAAIVAPLARMAGYRAVYRRFSGEEW